MPVTPMMRQYLQMKEENPGALLMFRLGDFYELFFDDAETASRELELTLTGRDCGQSERAPMCGVPYHAVEGYIARLVAKGYRVAVCDQMTDPALSKGLVERSVTRVVTPGTLSDPELLDDKSPSFIVSVCVSKERAGIAYCDVSTGFFSAYQIGQAGARLTDELKRISPKEALVCADRALDLESLYYVNKDFGDSHFAYPDAKKAILAHFAPRTLLELGLEKDKLAVCAAGALLNYLADTQKNALVHIRTLTRYQAERYMALDPAARSSLELTESMRTRARAGSLFALLDKTVTAMGGRMLRGWVEQPLAEREAIEARLDAVECLTNDPILRDALRAALKPVRDVERLLSRIAFERINPRECLSLAATLRALPLLRKLLADSRGVMRAVYEQLEPMDDLCELLTRAIDPDAPILIKDGGMIRLGYDAALDELKNASTDGKSWIAALEKRERDETGIKNLKVSYNRVFGYYIEVTKSYFELVPDRYVRKQTLASCERYITEELKELEKKVLGAEDEAVRLEYELFAAIRSRLLDELSPLSRVAEGLKTLDALLSLSVCASEYDYVRPQINDEGIYDIAGGRHPVVERSVSGESFVPNDAHLNRAERVMIITGPNMAGKSTYMRQVALIVLMAHMGSFVPAESANIALTDQIFTRVGASDDLFGGKSTFMVEMNELAYIFRNASAKSLILLDEVGRGTSTFDGLSIAWAATEHIADLKKCGATTLFATHYHELSELEGQVEGVVNYRITARERGDDVVFLRKIMRGGTDKSYGVAVAALAGLPANMIQRARQIMARLEVNEERNGGAGKSILDSRKNGGTRQIALGESGPIELAEEIRALDVMSMSPIDALNTLFTLCEKARRI